jgi:hypothetical protein
MRNVQQKTKPSRVSKPMRILLGQLGSYGDCLYATTVARQIKADYPESHLTWAIASAYRDILEGNPHVDEIWELALWNRSEVESGWDAFAKTALERRKRGDFDMVFLTQLNPRNLHRFDGSIRFSIYRGYSGRMTVPLAPIVRLSPEEVENVRRFANLNRLRDSSHVVLFECSPKSNQSFVTPEIAMAVADKVTSRLSDVRIILASNVQISTNEPRIIDGSVLSFRENAELTKYCSLLVGCSSGISWIATSEWAKPLPMIQFLQSDTLFNNSFDYDSRRRNAPAEDLIEMTECSSERISDCLLDVISNGIREAKPKFHHPAPIQFNTYRRINDILMIYGDYSKALYLLGVNIRCHGLHFGLLLQFIKSVINRLLVQLGIGNTCRKMAAFCRDLLTS